MKRTSKPTKNRAAQKRKVRRKPINTAVLPVAVNAPEAGRASIPVAVTYGPSGEKFVPVAVRQSSGETVIPAEVNRRGSRSRKRSAAIRIDVRKRTKPLNRRSSDETRKTQAARRQMRRDPITNALVTATRVEENAITLATQIGITAIDLLETWSRFLLNRGMRVAQATERGMMGEAARELKPPLPSRPMVEAEVRFPGGREPQEFRIAV